MQNLSSFVRHEIQKIDNITADFSPLKPKCTSTPTQQDDCRVANGCSQNSNCCVAQNNTPPPTPLQDFHAKLLQMEEEMEHNNKQLQHEIEVLDNKINWLEEGCPDDFEIWNTHQVLEDQFSSW